MPSFSNMSINAMPRAAKTSVFEYRQPAADIEARLSRAQLEKKNTELIQDLEECEKEKKRLETLQQEESAEPEDRGPDSDGTKPPLESEPSFLKWPFDDQVRSPIDPRVSVSRSAEHPTAYDEDSFDDLNTYWLSVPAVLGGGYVKAATMFFPNHVVMVQIVPGANGVSNGYSVYLASPDAASGDQAAVTGTLSAERKRQEEEEAAENPNTDGDRLRRAEAMKPIGPTGPAPPKQPYPTPPPPNRGTTRPPITATSRGNVGGGPPLKISIESDRPTEITPELYKYLDVSFEDGGTPLENESLSPHPAMRGWSMEFPEHFLWVRNYKNPTTGRVSWRCSRPTAAGRRAASKLFSRAATL